MEKKVYKKICKYCGKEFETTSPVKKFCDRPHYNICEYCGKTFEIKNIHYISRTCSRECEGKLRRDHAQATSLELYGVKNAGYTEESQEKIKNTNQKRYGVDYTFQAESVKKNIQKTMMEKYGVDNPMKSEEFKKKVEETNLEKYGVRNLLCSDSPLKDKIDQTNLEKYGTLDPGNRPEAQEKRKETNIQKFGKEYYTQTEEYKERVKETDREKYGVDYHFQAQEVKDKIKETNLKRYGVENVSQNPEIQNKMIQTNLKKYGCWYGLQTPQCRSTNSESTSNLTFKQLLEDNNIEYTREFPLENFQYDFKVGNTLIEINPSITHNTVVDPWNEPINEQYHKNKSLVAQKNGYKCIHVWDWDNVNLIVDMLRPKTIIDSEECEIREVSVNDCAEFLKNYNLLGNCKGQEIRLGLYKEDSLIEIMTFGKPRYNKNYQFEILRMCYEPSINVKNGFSKLFHYFLKNYNPESMITYCDLSKFRGTTYIEELEFHLDHKTNPSLTWSKNNKHISNSLLEKVGYSNLFPHIEVEENVSNFDLMLRDNWLPVFDCGQGVFVWSK